MEEQRAGFIFCPGPVYFSDYAVLSPCFLRILIPGLLLGYLAVAWAIKTFLTGKFGATAEGAGYVRLDHEEYAGETQHLLSEGKSNKTLISTLPGRVARKIIEHVPNPRSVLDKALLDVKVIVHLLIAEVVIVLVAFWFKSDEKMPIAHRMYPYYVGLWMLAVVPWLLHAHMLSRASRSGTITDFLSRGGHDSKNLKGFWLIALLLTLLELQHFAVYRKHYLTIGSSSPYAWAAILVASPIIRALGLLPLVFNVLFLELGAAKPEHNPAYDIEGGIPDAAAPIEYEHDVERRQQVLGAHPHAAHSPTRTNRSNRVESPSPRSQKADSLQSEFETILAAARAARQPAPTQSSEPLTRSIQSEGPSASKNPASAAELAGQAAPIDSSNQATRPATDIKVEAPKASPKKPAAPAISGTVHTDAPKSAPAPQVPASGHSTLRNSPQPDEAKPESVQLSDKPQQKIETPSKTHGASVSGTPSSKDQSTKPESHNLVQDVPAPPTSAVADVVADTPAAAAAAPPPMLRHLSTAESTESLNNTGSTNGDEDDDDVSGAKPAGPSDGAAAKKKKNKKKKKGKK
ncbi:hypothetical protein HDU86_005122 [Geranomyces michiganensis]|nr:hypothetical protein HDU86_005122 [Geranomyces michiganensis]